MVLSDGLEKIGANAFAGCSKLASVDFGDNSSLTEIGTAAFASCTSLGEAALPDTVAELGMRAFKDCSSLSSVNIPDSLKIIREETFAYTALTEIDIKNVESLYNQAFRGATELETVTGGNSLIEAGSYVFGSLLSSNSEEAAPWLATSGVQYDFNGEKGATVTYLGNVLIYVHPVETKPAPVYVQPDTVSIAAQAFSDVSGAVAVFLGTKPPTYGSQAFGYSSGAPTTDIVVPAGATERFTRAFLVASKDEGGYYVPSAYSLALIQKIYEFASAPFDGIVYSRYPLKADESGVYFSKLQAANEELLTANEELQSSTEELQSVNEELYTVIPDEQLETMSEAEQNAYASQKKAAQERYNSISGIANYVNSGVYTMDEAFMAVTGEVSADISVSATVVGRSDSAFSPEFIEAVFKQAVGSAFIITNSDRSYLYFIERVDLLADEYSFYEDYRDRCLVALSDGFFVNEINSWVQDYSAVRHLSVVNRCFSKIKSVDRSKYTGTDDYVFKSFEYKE